MNTDTSIERAFRRRLALLALLHQRPHHYNEIITALDREHLFSYDFAEDKATITRLQKYQFRNDKRALKKLGHDIVFDRKTRCYSWCNSPFGLFFDREQLHVFALLCAMFAGSTFPHAGEIQALLHLLGERLPTDQQKMLQDMKLALNIDLHETTDYRLADAATLKQIEMAIQRSQQLEFTYCAPHSGKERRHVIEPQPLVLEHGHVYLHGRSPDGNKELRFRLDYIVPGSAQMLHISSTNNRPFARSYRLRYWLSPVIARNKVSEHFPGQTVEKHPDDSATVTACITSLFDARRIVLSYGINCVVLEPPELVAQMRMVRDHFNKTYPTPSE